VIADTLSLTLYCVLEWQQRHLVNHTKKHRAHRHTSLRWRSRFPGSRPPLFKHPQRANGPPGLCGGSLGLAMPSARQEDAHGASVIPSLCCY